MEWKEDTIFKLQNQNLPIRPSEFSSEFCITYMYIDNIKEQTSKWDICVCFFNIYILSWFWLCVLFIKSLGIS